MFIIIINLGNKMEFPPKSQTYPLYDNIYEMVHTRNDQEISMCTSQSRPVPRSDRSANGTSGNSYNSGLVTATRVAGTGHHLTVQDVDNTSTPPDQVERPCHQT